MEPQPGAWVCGHTGGEKGSSQAQPAFPFLRRREASASGRCFWGRSVITRLSPCAAEPHSVAWVTQRDNVQVEIQRGDEW